MTWISKIINFGALLYARREGEVQVEQNAHSSASAEFT